MLITDFHSHILPSLDDGSKSVEESIRMLEMLKSQHVGRVVATPHFYPNQQSVDKFLERRKKSYSSLQSSLNDEYPEIVQGAEVKYFDGISRMEGLERLCIEGTNLILIEMPCCEWTDFVIRELHNLVLRRDMRIVLAHIERFIRYQPSSVFDDLLRSDVLMQINASYINSFFTRRKALNFLHSGCVHFIGTDCHNMTDRLPEIKSAINHIIDKLGENFFYDFVNYGNEFFCKNKE